MNIIELTERRKQAKQLQEELWKDLNSDPYRSQARAEFEQELSARNVYRKQNPLPADYNVLTVYEWKSSFDFPSK